MEPARPRRSIDACRVVPRAVPRPQRASRTRHAGRACHPMSMPTTHARAADTALLLVNLGTPDAPTPRAVRRYLAEFLHDHRVVQLSRWLWCPLLHFVILPLRGPRVAAKYSEIWMGEGSPLAVH